MCDQLQYVTIMYQHYIIACDYKHARVYDSLLLLRFYAEINRTNITSICMFLSTHVCTCNTLIKESELDAKWKILLR